MKIFILYDHKYEVSISRDLYVQNVKDKFDNTFRGNGMFSKPYYKLIYQNIILCEKNHIEYYNIRDNDEIWIGTLENYVKSDDVIVEVFLVGLNPSIMWIIAEKNCCIKSIISRIKNTQIRIIKIFDENGNNAEINQTINKIGNNRCKKLFIIYDDNPKYDNDYTFANCCKIHDKYWIDKLINIRDNYEDDGDETLREYLIKLVNDLKKILSINNTIYSGLNKKLNFPLALINSGFLFCRDVTDRIIDNFRSELKLEDQIMEYDLLFWRFLDDAIISWLYNFVDSTKDQRIEENESYFQNILFKLRNIFNLFTDTNITSILMRDIIVNSLGIFMNNLHCPGNWKHSMRLWINQILTTKINKIEMEHIFMKQNKSCMVLVKMFNMKFELKVPRNTMNEVKEAVGTQTGLEEIRIICINPGRNCNPTENEWNNQSIFEVAYKINENFSHKIIGNGISRTILLENNKTGEKIVLKKPHHNQEEIYKDICIQSKLSSSKLIKIYSKLYWFDGFICVGMEYILNESLDSYLKRKDLSEKEILKIAHQILVQIEELHKFEIVHCDIKCSNVCIDAHGNAKIIDFGLSQDITDASTKLSVGTLRYCAPEIIKKEPCSYGIDIWAFGMLLVEIVTKNIPFPDIKNNRFIFELECMKKYEFKPICSISQDFVQLIEACLTIPPSARPTAKQLLEFTVFTM